MKALNQYFQSYMIVVVGALTIAVVPCISTRAVAETFYYQQTNLVSNIPGLAANTDADLVNPWGISFSGTGPFWVSDNGTGKSTLYNSNGIKQGLVVSIPGDGSVTGQVFNGGSSFNGDRFIFASEDGTISGWRGALGTNAETLKAGSSASVYKGLALGSISDNYYLYAANFKNGTIDVIKGSGSPDLTGTFTDPNIPAGFAPFNIQKLGGTLFVTYALQDANGKDDVAGDGNGFVDEFDLNGNLIQRLVSNGPLNSPWGLAIAPTNFGTFSNTLLVGNFGDGKINAFDPNTGNLLGQLKDANGNIIVIDGLWSLAFGNGSNAGRANELFFTAGINNERDGLFGKLEASPVPEPATISLFSLGLIPILALFCRQNG